MAREEEKKRKAEERRQEGMKYLEQLSSMAGLKDIKVQVDQIVKTHEMGKKRREMGLKCESQSLHMIFTGKPGTGKTTAARIIGNGFVRMGMLKGNDDEDEIPFVEVHHVDIESPYVGVAEKKMKEKFEEARGGVLFIDEAYAFAGPHSYHKSLFAVIVQMVEDMRDEVLVIAAGYPEEMEEFLDFNPGMRSRFSSVIHFEDYPTEDLVRIAENMCRDRDYEMTEKYKEKLGFRLNKERRLKSFGNARTVRSIIENSIRLQSSRVSAIENPTRVDLVSLTESDIDTSVRLPLGPESGGQHHHHQHSHQIESIGIVVMGEKIKKSEDKDYH